MEFNINKTIDMEFAKNALTETEYKILATLFNKVENYKIEQHMKRMAILENLSWGPPGIGKTENIANIIKSHGFKIVPVYHGLQDPPSNYGADFPEPFVKASELFSNKISKKTNKSEYLVLVQKIKELRSKNIPEDIIDRMFVESCELDIETVEYIENLERKSKEAGVSLTMYVRQGMNK